PLPPRSTLFPYTTLFRSRVALAGDALGLLRGEPPVPQPAAEVPGVEADPELLRDQVGQPRAGPERGGEAVFGRALGQPPPHDLLLGGGELPRPSGDGPGGEPRVAVLPEGGHPAPHGRGLDPQEVGDLLRRVPLQQGLDG